jgi:hypothetical protein
MLKRAFLGLFKGLLLGVIAAAAIVYGLGQLSFGAFLAYASAALLGLIAGLVTGKPIWAPDAKIEAGLKSVVGALLAVGVLFGVRKWLPLSLDLSAFGGGAGAVGALPLAALPLIGAVVGMIFELDNTDAPPAAPRTRVSAEAEELGRGNGADFVEDEIPAASERARQRR